MLSRCATGVLLLCATSAGADSHRVSRRLPERVSGALVRSDATAPTCSGLFGFSTPCTLDVQYYGGSVLSNVKVYAVFWDNTVNPDVFQGMAGFYQTLTNSQWMDWRTEYTTTIIVEAGSHAGQPGTQQVIGRGTFAGSYTLGQLSQQYYGGCSSLSTTGLTCVADSDLQNELVFQILNHHLPAPDNNTLYMVHFPPSVQINLTNPSLTSCVEFCAYHNSFQDPRLPGVTVVYGVLPDLANNGCQDGCGTGSLFENTCSAASHELAEASTDAMVGLVTGTTVDFPLGWYDSGQGEIADMCDQQTDTLGENGVPGCAAGDAGCYTVQQVFSRVVWNADPADQPNVAACVSSRFDADDYFIAFSPNTLTLVRGVETAVVPVVTTLTNGTPQPLTLSVTGLPPGLHASFDEASSVVGEAANLTVSSDPDATIVKDGVLVVQASGAATHSAALLVHLLPQNAWNLVISPATALLLRGGSQTFTITGNVMAGTGEPVALSSTVTGLPPGVTASFNSLTLTPGASTAQVTLSASPDAPGVPLTAFGVRGVSASQPLGHGGGASIQVDTPPGMTITSPTAGATVDSYQLVSVVANPGSNSSLRYINFTLDDEVELSIGSASTFLWNTLEVANGSHTVHVRTFDADGAGSSASVTVTVANASGGGCSSSGPSPSTVALLLALGAFGRRRLPARAEKAASAGGRTRPS
ncbi:MAG: Ig-like domain-containing protein [Myxococcaceae bacterium]